MKQATKKEPRIQKLNDEARAQLIKVINNEPLHNAHLRITFTWDVNNLEKSSLNRLLQKFIDFKDFNKKNDPHGEHDFVKVEHEGQKYFLKIDYYDTKLDNHSPNPSDEHQTIRVLTIMNANEY